MAVTNYYTIDGQMIGYKDGGGRKDFLTDVLGSVTAEIDQAGTNRTFDGRYRPYGGDLWSSGSRGSFGWDGTWGYRSTSLKNSSHYVRARHFAQTSGTWTTLDELWPRERAYVYVDDRAVCLIDPLGLTSDSPNSSFLKSIEDRIKKDGFPAQNCHTSQNLHIKYIDPFDCYSCAGPNSAPTQKGFNAGRAYCDDKKNVIGLPIKEWTKFCIEEGPGGAMRHCVGACEMTRTCGPICAEVALGMHEKLGGVSAKVNPGLSDNDRKAGYFDTCMDMYNNIIGAQLSKQNGTCESLCLNALSKGNLLLRQKLGRKGVTVSDINCSKYQVL